MTNIKIYSDGSVIQNSKYVAKINIVKDGKRQLRRIESHDPLITSKRYLDVTHTYHTPEINDVVANWMGA
jgi:hypothetical protein